MPPENGPSTFRTILSAMLPAVLIAAACILGLQTYTIMNAGGALENTNSHALIRVLNADLLVLLLVAVFIAPKLIALWSQLKRGVPGSKLQIRLAGLFTFIAAVPAIVTALFSAGLLYYGIHGWFDTRVREAVNESQAVAQAYLAEHQQLIRADVLAMASDLNRQSLLFTANPEALGRMMETQSYLRNFSEATLFDNQRRVIAQSGISLSMSVDPIPESFLNQAREGDVVVMTSDDDDRIRALIRLNTLDETFLYVGRLVDPTVLGHLDATREAARQYDDLMANSGRIQAMMMALYVTITLLLMMGALWTALVIARRLVAPIGGMIAVAERLRAGDMTARISEDAPGNVEEFGTLAKAFNRMTDEIERQRNALIDANQMLDERRRFTETVLGGVSTGILGIARDGQIMLANPAAHGIFNVAEGKLGGQNITEMVSEMEGLLGELFGETEQPMRIERQMSLLRRDGARRQVLVRAVAENDSAVIALDDITDLMSAQKTAAWADVARRIAHEIKNPLTPIQLSAERIRRKYMSAALDDADKDTIGRCTDTIVRHVDDIKNMVNAFANFAKMPDAKLKPIDLWHVARETFLLQREARGEIEFTVDGDARAQLPISGDENLIRQALTNLILNAVDAVSANEGPKKVALFHGHDKNGVYIGIADNGPGIAPDMKDKVFEPYVTGKAKGTGLGLAIVRKVMDDHGGNVDIMQETPHLSGADIRLHFPKA